MPPASPSTPEPLQALMREFFPDALTWNAREERLCVEVAALRQRLADAELLVAKLDGIAERGQNGSALQAFGALTELRAALEACLE